MQNIILIGGGGHCKSVIDTITDKSEFNIIGVLDLKDKIGTYINGVEIIGTDDDLEYYYDKGIRNAFITVGSIGDTSLREKLFENAKKIGFKFPLIMDKTSVISKNVELEEGTYVGKAVVINAHSKIGKNCIINTGAILDHDCIIKDFVHIATGSVLSGGVEIGERTHIGTNTTIINHKKIGEGIIIGAGSVVVKDIISGVKAYGNPCRVVE